MSQCTVADKTKLRDQEWEAIAAQLKKIAGIHNSQPMLIMNKKMSVELDNINRDCKTLPSELSELISQGFCIREGCTLLAALAKGSTNVSAGDFPDKTGYECFINSVHVDDYVQSNYLDYACLFAEALLNAWRKSSTSDTAIVIVSSDEFGAVVKLHVTRSGEAWVSNDLERYEEAIFVADSSLMSLH